MLTRTFKTLAVLIALSISSAAVAQQTRPLAQKLGRQASAAPAVASPPTTEELLYVPLPVCRAFYTASSSGVIAASGSRDFYISGTGSQFANQGGTSNGCGVPANATAAAISFTAFNTTGYGGLLAYAQGTTKPALGRILSYQAGQTVTGTAIVPLANNEITLTALSAATQAAGDVTGYYIPQIEAFILPNGSIFSNTSRILSVSHTSTGVYVITADSNVYTCAVHATLSSIGFVIAYSSSGSAIVVDTYSSSGALADQSFNLSVHC